MELIEQHLEGAYPTYGPAGGMLAAFSSPKRRSEVGWAVAPMVRPVTMAGVRLQT